MLLSVEFSGCSLEPLQIVVVVVALKRRADEPVITALEHWNLDSVDVVETLLQILRRIFREAERDHLREEVAQIRGERLEAKLVSRSPRELVAALAHRIPLVLPLPRDRGGHGQIGRRVPRSLFLVS